MPTYTYQGEPGRYYPSLALTAMPGDAVTLDANPGDGRWLPLDADQPPATPPPESPAAPVTPTDPGPGDAPATTPKGK